jgi:hypothetical protein
MLSAIKSAFTTESTPQTVYPLKVATTKIAVAEPRHAAIETWGRDDSGQSGLASLKTMLNRVGLDLAMLDGKFVTQDDFAIITTKNKQRVALLRGYYDSGLIESYKEHGADKWGRYGHTIEIKQSGDKSVYGPVYNDALNVVNSWARGRSGGKKRRSKTQKKKRVSRKSRRHSR